MTFYTDAAQLNADAAQLNADAAQLNAMASFLRCAADVDISTMYEVERQDFERDLRSRIKATIQTLLNNLPV